MGTSTSYLELLDLVNIIFGLVLHRKQLRNTSMKPTSTTTFGRLVAAATWLPPDLWLSEQRSQEEDAAAEMLFLYCCRHGVGRWDG